jgi:hypothetical protein
MFAGVQRANFILEFKDKTDFQGKTKLLLKHVFKSLLSIWISKNGLVHSYERWCSIRSWRWKAIPRSSIADVYKSIQNDLIYASDNLSIAAQKGEQQVVQL